jgi:adenylate cyclase
VGLSVTLLAIMLAAAVYAFVQSAKVNRETALLVEVLEPLKREVATIEEFAAEEELASERALRYGGPQVRDAALHESYLERFRALNTRVDSQLAQLDTHISRFETMPVSNDVAVFLGRLQLESEAVRREHAAYRAAMDAFLDPKAPAMVDGVRLRQNTAMDAERRVLAAMERMSREASVLSGKDERQLEALERRGFSVTVENLILAVFAFLAGAVISVLLTRRMLTPVRSLIAGAEEVGRGNLEVSLPATTHDELGQLTTAFSAMVEELRQKVALKNTFSSYMDPAWSIACWAPTARSWKPAKSAR